MPFAYAQWIAEFCVSMLPNCTLKTLCEYTIERAVLFVKTANIKVVSNLGKLENSYTVIEIDHFLQLDVCDALIKLAKEKGVRDSTIVDDRGTSVLDLHTRKSKQTWLKDADDVVVSDLSAAVSRLTQMPVSHQEDLQVVSYPVSGYYNAHFDASFHPSVIPLMNRGCGPRLYTFLVYLNDDFQGGETDFPQIGVTIKPAKGKAIIFQNIDDNFDLIPESMHAGCKVTKGTKWVANKWIRIWPFELAAIAHANATKQCYKRIWPTTPAMIYNNIMTYNSPFICQSKIASVEIIEIEDFLTSNACDQLASGTATLLAIDADMTEQLAAILPIPWRDKTAHIQPLSLYAHHNMAAVFFSLYIFLDDADGAGVYFPYMQRTIDAKKGKAFGVFNLDDTLLWNPASSHKSVKDSRIAQKHVTVMPAGFHHSIDRDRLIETLKDMKMIES